MPVPFIETACCNNKKKKKTQPKKTGLQVHLLFVAAVLVSLSPPALWSAEPELTGQNKCNAEAKRKMTLAY